MAESDNPQDQDGSTRYQPVLEWLRQHANLSASAEQSAERAAQLYDEPIPLALNRIGVIGDADLQAAMMAATGYPAASGQPDSSMLSDLSSAFLKARRAMPIGRDTERIVLGLIDPLDDAAIRGVAFATGLRVEPAVLRVGAFRQMYADAFERDDSSWAKDAGDSLDTRTDSALEFGRDAPVARRVARWLAVAVERRASDVHIEPRTHALVVRYRIDGRLETVAEEPLAASDSVIARIKVLSDLDLGDRRAAQDGRTTIVISGRPIDVRVSIVPSVNGESAVLRILDRAEVRLTFEDLGFAVPERDLLNQAIAAPNGLVLVTGPTGSGKTTTLYAAVEALRSSNRKVLTIEDPVEYYFDHVTQVQYAPKAGVTFPSAIRAFLRQDPDVILVGEIRDGDTARAAVEAALTGHLVLASLHAIDAPKAIPRLIDMGVEPFQLAATLRAVVAQRLVRRLCTQCAGDITGSAKCPHCGGTGFLGRICIAEGFQATPALLEAIRTSSDPLSAAASTLIRTMSEDGGEKCKDGLTTLDELSRALAS